jgi:hypothetical protein
VSSNAHYKIDTDSKNRTANNFTRDDSYMAERASHAQGKSKHDVIRNGPSASRGKKGGKYSSGFSMHGTSYHSTGSLDAGTDAPSKTSGSSGPKALDSLPVGAGESPSPTFVRNALAGGVLCSKCSLATTVARR